MSAETPTGTSPRETRRFLLAFLGVAVVIAAVVSFYASSHPDGLEFVAGSTGFLDTAEDSAAAGSPLAGYGVAGLQDARLSGGVAGVIGVLVTLLLAGSLTWLLRRRSDSPKA
ncbi:MAG TPA: PDGLE domain-containing protein [Microlunatus sp.]|nr:PDGLE domain-containing protein [Microlunatus sp.]